MQKFISKTKTLTYHTKYRLHFINITKDVQGFIKESKIKIGLIVVQTLHTTCGLWINEDEKNLVGNEKDLGYASDLKKILDRFASPNEEYHHNDVCDIKNPNGKRNTHLCEPGEDGTIRECINGHSHAQNMILQSSISMIIEKGELLKGDWQQIMLVELDHDRERKVTLLVQGIGKELHKNNTNKPSDI